MSHTPIKLKIIDDKAVTDAIQRSPWLFEKILKKELAKEGNELRKDTLNELKKHQKGKWILEQVIITRVRGNMKRGFISLRQGISGKLTGKTDRGDPQQYGYYIEHGNEGKREQQEGNARLVKSRKNRQHFYKEEWQPIEVVARYWRGVGYQRKPRPFMEPARERYIDSGRGEAAIQKAIDDLIEKFNAGT